MPNYFKDKAAVLAANGYLPIPIKPGTKKCQEPKWPNFRFTPKDAEAFANYGIGILCGQGEYPLMAIDCDTTDPVLLDRLRNALGDNGVGGLHVTGIEDNRAENPLPICGREGRNRKDELGQIRR